uniref:Uncharacterized protein n=1 Tax=Eutreptiella gymnastica TaxID=73025 RepID=A0A7S4G5Y4_9EUGL
MTGEINSDRGHLQRKNRRAQCNQKFPEEMSKWRSPQVGGIARGGEGRTQKMSQIQPLGVHNMEYPKICMPYHPLQVHSFVQPSWCNHSSTSECQAMSVTQDT